MEELYNKLVAVPDSYFGFIMGIMTYVKQKPERLQKVLDFMDSSDTLTSSDIVEFVSDQPDFHEFGVEQETNKAVYKG